MNSSFWNLENLVKAFSIENQKALLHESLHGLEKECLRTLPNGDLALTPHPTALGDKSTNPHITTDFSESQLEFITHPFRSIPEVLDQLTRLHSFTARRLQGEWLWPLSMPPRLPSEDKIPIAYYGESEEGRLRHLYRKGLAYRYGKMMQMVSGVHYNVSFSDRLFEVLREKVGSSIPMPDFRSEAYLRIVRNFIRNRWLLVYLFGASPTYDSTYKCSLMDEAIASCTEKREEAKQYAISIRTSRCGYSNPAKIQVSYNSPEQHWADLKKALETPHPYYTKLGIYKEGEQIQLNDHLLQLPSEYYYPIRMKPILQDPVGYLEVRLFDLNPWSPIGVSEETLYFTYLFLLYCLFSDSPNISESDLIEASDLQQNVSFRGRNKRLHLKEKALVMIQEMQALAELLDDGQKEGFYQIILKSMLERTSDLLSQRVIDEMGARTFLEWGLDKALEHHEFLLQLPDDPSFSNTRV